MSLYDSLIASRGMEPSGICRKQVLCLAEDFSRNRQAIRLEREDLTSIQDSQTEAALDLCLDRSGKSTKDALREKYSADWKLPTALKLTPPMHGLPQGCQHILRPLRQAARKRLRLRGEPQKVEYCPLTPLVILPLFAT